MKNYSLDFLDDLNWDYSGLDFELAVKCESTYSTVEQLRLAFRLCQQYQPTVHLYRSPDEVETLSDSNQIRERLDQHNATNHSSVIHFQSIWSPYKFELTCDDPRLLTLCIASEHYYTGCIFKDLKRIRELINIMSLISIELGEFTFSFDSESEAKQIILDRKSGSRAFDPDKKALFENFFSRVLNELRTHV